MRHFPRCCRSLAVLIFLGTTAAWQACPAAHAGLLPVRKDEALKSLEAEGPGWLAKVDALGRPRLLLDRAGLDALKGRAASSPEARRLVDQAYMLVAAGFPRPYAAPEEYVKKGITPFDANGELWIRTAGDDLVLLAVAAAIDPSPMLKKAVHDGAIGICRYPTWGRKAAVPESNMDLSCAHVATGIALAWDWHPELWQSEEDRTLILGTVAERLGQLLAGLYGKGFWAANYADNHNHVDTCGLAWCGLAFYREIPAAPEWLAAARLDFRNVAKEFPGDGSSSEGVPYWSYGMTYILGYIEATRRVLDSGDLYQAPFLRNAAAYRLNVSTSGLAGTLPWGDAPSRDFYGPQHILQRLAAEYRDPAAAWLAAHLPWKASGGLVQAMAVLWPVPEAMGQALPALPLDDRLPAGDIATLRSGWGPGDYLLAVKSGFTNRNHSHLDAGALAFAFGGEWLLTTPGYGKGSGQADFWDAAGRRWTYFSNSTESHCTLLVNGGNQRFDREARGTIDAFLSTPFYSWVGIDLTQAYKASEVAAVRREILHRRGEYILVFDSVKGTETPLPPQETAPPLAVEWLAQLPAVQEGSGDALLAKGDAGQLRLRMLFPSQPFVPRQPTAPHVDIPAEQIHTYAVKSVDPAPSFVALLQPVFGSGEQPPLNASVAERKGGAFHVVIRGADWIDHVLTGALVRASPVAAEAGIRAEAGVLAVRLGGKEKEPEALSCLAVAATALECPALSIVSESPVSVGLQRMPDGSWIVDAARDVRAAITAQKGFTVLPMAKTEEGFRCVVAKPGTTARSAADWLASFAVYREKAAVPIRALPPQSSLSPSVTIPVEAESFASQKQGKAEAVRGKPGAAGATVRGFGASSSDHSIGWTIDVAQAGKYRLMLRYATKLDGVSLAVLIDGAAPSKEALKAALPATGGWSIDRDDWKEIELTDGEGRPLVFDLSAGRHELRLARPTGAIALDRFEFRGTAN